MKSHTTTKIDGDGYLFVTKPSCNIQRRREYLKKKDRERESTCSFGMERMGGRDLQGDERVLRVIFKSNFKCLRHKWGDRGKQKAHDHLTFLVIMTKNTLPVAV
ncbi:hypothetical protein AAC387_Pa06g2440 [Persea americana]